VALAQQVRQRRSQLERTVVEAPAAVQDVAKELEARRGAVGALVAQLRLAKSALKRHTKDYEESKMAAAAAATRMQAEENFCPGRESITRLGTTGLRHCGRATCGCFEG
jgi:ABC-type transporter Mla subunit MlaD